MIILQECTANINLYKLPTLAIPIVISFFIYISCFHLSEHLRFQIVFLLFSNIPRRLSRESESCFRTLQRPTLNNRIPLPYWRQRLRMEIIRCKSRLDFWAGSKKSLIRATSDGIGRNFWCGLDVKPSELLIQFQFKHTTVYKSTCIDSNYDFVCDQSSEGVQARCEILVFENLCKNISVFLL